MVSCGASGRSGEIGIRRGFKIPRLHGRAGSTPASGTTECTRQSAGREGMRKISGRIAALALVAVTLPLILATAASAEFRDFSGKVTEISGDKMVIDNRQGDRVSFRRSEATTVSGAKTSWQAIEVGDRVSVSWKLVDKPRIAHKVVVKPPQQKSSE